MLTTLVMLIIDVKVSGVVHALVYSWLIPNWVPKTKFLITGWWQGLPAGIHSWTRAQRLFPLLITVVLGFQLGISAVSIWADCLVVRNWQQGEAEIIWPEIAWVPTKKIKENCCSPPFMTFSWLWSIARHTQEMLNTKIRQFRQLAMHQGQEYATWLLCYLWFLKCIQKHYS